MNVISYFRLGAIFLLGTLAGRSLWQYIVLPYRNPLGIVGYLAQIEKNPWDDVLAFALLALLPVFIVVFLWQLNPSYLGFSGQEQSAVRADGESGAAAALPGYSGVMILCFFSVLAALAIPTHFSYQPYVDTFHEGEALGTAQSLSASAKPYRDVVFIHGVYQDPGRALLAFKLFGRSIGAVRALESIHKVCAFILLAILLWILFKGSFAAPFLGLCLLISLHHFPRSGLAPYLWIPPRDLLVFVWLISIMCVGRTFSSNTQKNSTPSAFVLGLVLIGAFAYSVDRAIQINAATLLLGLLCASAGLHKGVAWLRALGAVVLGGLVGFVLLGIFLHGEFLAFADYVFIKLPLIKDFLDGLPYPIADTTHFVLVSLVSLNVFVLFVRFARVLARDGQNLRDALKIFCQNNFSELALCFVSLTMFRTALVTSNWEHIVYSLAPTFILNIKFFFDALPLFWRRQVVFPKRQQSLLGALGVLLGFYFLAPIPESGALLRNFPVQVQDRDFLQEKDQGLIEFFARQDLAPGEFFSLTPEAFWYYLLDVPSPTRFPINWFALLPEYQRDLVQDLEKNQVKWVLYSNEHWSNKIDRIAHSQRLPVVFDYIHKHYEPYKTIADHHIWRRRAATVIFEQQNE